jgi:hypothetical protein
MKLRFDEMVTIAIKPKGPNMIAKIVIYVWGGELSFDNK